MFMCFTCGKRYDREVNETYVDGRCPQCAGYSDKNSITLECGRTARFGNLASGTHRRRSFIFGGEEWSCPIQKNTYDTLSGTSTYSCDKKASVHVKMPSGVSLPVSSRSDRCGVVCEKHAKSLLQHGAEILTLRPMGTFSKLIEYEILQQQAVIRTSITRHSSGIGSMITGHGLLQGTQNGELLFVCDGEVKLFTNEIRYWGITNEPQYPKAVIAADSETFLMSTPNDASRWFNFLSNMYPTKERPAEYL